MIHNKTSTFDNFSIVRYNMVSSIVNVYCETINTTIVSFNKLMENLSKSAVFSAEAFKARYSGKR